MWKILDFFLTNIIGSCAQAKILDVINMIDREMSFPEGEIPRRQSLVTRAYKRKVLTDDSQYVRKNIDLLEQGPRYGVPFPPKFNVPFYIVLCTIYRTFWVCHLNLHSRFNVFAFNIQLWLMQHSSFRGTQPEYKFKTTQNIALLNVF